MCFSVLVQGQDILKSSSAEVVRGAVQRAAGRAPRPWVFMRFHAFGAIKNSQKGSSKAAKSSEKQLEDGTARFDLGFGLRFDPVRLRLSWQAQNPPDVERCKLCSAYREAHVLHRIDESALRALLPEE